MWKVYPGGNLHVYDGQEFEITGVEHSNFSVTPNGDYLMAFTDQEIFVWSYPVYSIGDSK